MSTREVSIHAGLAEAAPGDVGYDPCVIDKLDAHLAGLVRTKKLQCASYQLSRNGKTFAVKSMGRLTHHNKSGDLMPDSIRKIASITKLFTAVSIMKLVEDGALHHGQAVSTIIDEFKTDMHGGITIAHLLTHTSGLPADPGYFSEPNPHGWWEDFDGKSKDANWIKATLAGPLQSKPGERWSYSSSGFGVLGEIVSRVSGMPYERFVEENITKPLGMKETFFEVPQHLRGRVCVTSAEDEKRLTARKGSGGAPMHAAGGWFSTLADLTTLAQMLLNKGTHGGARILGRRTVEEMTRNQLQPGVFAYSWGACIKDCSYGLGVSLHTSDTCRYSFGHEGAGRSALFVDPEERFTVVFFVPTTIEWVPESVLNVKAIIWSGLA